MKNFAILGMLAMLSTSLIAGVSRQEEQKQPAASSQTSTTTLTPQQKVIKEDQNDTTDVLDIPFDTSPVEEKLNDEELLRLQKYEEAKKKQEMKDSQANVTQQLPATK